MKLPNRERAIIPPDKLSGYLLSETHPDGKSKAVFFRQLGFDQQNADLLTAALLAIARENEVSRTATTLHGTKYVIEGPISGPGGKLARIRTVWIVDRGRTTPRFVTAYPAG
jgi:hypothetical protein